MSLSLNILVHDAEPALIKAMCERSRLARVSRNGTLVVSRVPDRDLSRAIYPNEWKVNEGRRSSRLVPDFSGGVVHSVYDFPEELANTPYRAVLEGAEVHIRGSYCQIVTDYDGGRLQPYRRESDSSRWSDTYMHPTASVFSAPKMGLLRLDHGLGFTIQRASVDIIDGVLTARTEELLRDDGRCELTQQLTSLPGELTVWSPALKAVLDRYRCDLQSCHGHFNL